MEKITTEIEALIAKYQKEYSEATSLSDQVKWIAKSNAATECLKIVLTEQIAQLKKAA